MNKNVYWLDLETDLKGSFYEEHYNGLIISAYITNGLKSVIEVSITGEYKQFDIEEKHEFDNT